MNLPGPSEEYDVYRMRLAQAEIIAARGYQIPDGMQYLVSEEGDDKQKFEYMLQYDQPVIRDPSKPWYYRTTLHRRVDQGENGNGIESLEAFVCAADQTDIIIHGMIKETVIETANMYVRINLLIITTQPYLDLIPNDKFNDIEVIPYQSVYINPVQHYRGATGYTVLTEEEKQQFLSNPRMRGARPPRILVTDPLVTYLGLKKGDIFSYQNNNLSSGALSARMLYREVIEPVSSIVVYNNNQKR